MLSVALAFLGRARLTANGPDDERASAVLGESLSLAQAAQSRYASGHALATWGDLRWEQGDPHDAVTAWSDALGVFSDLADPRGIAGCIERLALALLRSGRLEAAAWLFGAADAYHVALGLPVRPRDGADHAHFAQYADQQPARESFPAAWSAGSTASLHEAVARAIAYAEGLETAYIEACPPLGRLIAQVQVWERAHQLGERNGGLQMYQRPDNALVHLRP
jgi:hypothetical protein